MWLPDAMEGPTPVSALIHAATMVTAGVYLVARAHPLFENAPVALEIVAVIGGAHRPLRGNHCPLPTGYQARTGLFDHQPTWLHVHGRGCHNYTAGIFHLTTHAYFKALLFLGAGAVIHALAGEQDMRKMGGLRSRLPITFWTFLIAALAISGYSPLQVSGVKTKFSVRCWPMRRVLAILSSTSCGLLALLTVALTAFYMFRLFFGIFMGTYRGATVTCKDS